MDKNIEQILMQLHQEFAGLYQHSQYEQAMQPAVQMHEIATQKLESNHPAFAASLNNLAMLYSSMGNYTEAEPLFKQSIESWGKALGEDHQEFAASLYNLAELYDAMGNYTEAEKLYIQSMEIRRKTLGENDPSFLQSLNNLALLYKTMGKYAKAKPLYKQFMDSRCKILGEDHPDFATTLNNMADIYRSMGNYTKAESLYEQLIKIERKALMEEHPRFAISLNNLALNYTKKGDFLKAEPLYAQSMKILRKTVGEDHPDFAASLSNLALLYKTMGYYAKAESLYEQSIKILRKTMGETHPLFAASLNNTAALYVNMGNYAKAEPLYKQSMDILLETLGEDHPDFATSLDNLAGLYADMGNFVQAEPLSKQSIEIRRRVLGEKHPDFAVGLNNLAELYRSMGNYARTESLFERDEKQKLSLEKEAMGNYARAISLFEQCIEIRREVLGEDHPDFVVSLGNLALLFQLMGNYAKAESIYKQSLAIMAKTPEVNQPGFATNLNNFAAFLQSTGNYIKAEPLYKQSIEIRRNVLGEDHPKFAISLNNLALLYAATEQKNIALQLMTQASSINDQMIGQVFSIGSESQRAAFLQTIQENFNTFISLVYQCFASSPDVIQSTFDLVLRRKAISAEVLSVQRDAIIGGKYPELKEQYNALIQLRMQIAQKSLAGSGPEGYTEHQKTLAAWNRQKENFEAEIARKIPEMNLAKKLKDVNLQAIASALPADTILLEFVRFELFDFKAIPSNSESQWKPARYLAFVIANESDNVQMIDIGEAKTIDLQVAQFRDAIIFGPENEDPDRNINPPLQSGERMSESTTKPKGIFPRIRGFLNRSKHQENKRDLGTIPAQRILTQNYKEGIELWKTIFGKFLPTLSSAKHLIISPDGEFNRLPFEVLPDGNGNFLTDAFHISYLGAGRDILRFNQQSARQPSESLVIADPDFNLRKDKSADKNQQDTIHNRHSSDLTRGDIQFVYLPGTEVEGKSLSKMLKVQPWLQGQALEARLKQYHSPHILHIASHGFFLEDQKLDPNDKFRDLGALNPTEPNGYGRLSGPVHENPLLRSGLALAGANTWLKGQNPPEEAEDGLLTAEDVTGLDLLDTELVVLSACETGLGEIRTGEGVFGLRRSFVLAGADTLIMSLWKVPDKQTQELMEEFYSGIIQGKPRVEALRNAQMVIRSKYPHPFYWGAFICQGDPRPLKKGII